MDEDLKIIKKKYGEEMTHFCRESFPILLERKGLLPDLLLTKFEASKFLYNDLVKFKLEEKFKKYIYSLVNTQDILEENQNKSPKELLNEAGYDLYECHNEEEIQSFKKYYQPEEELCTFKGGRLNKCYVFFAVKHDVSNIKREDFNEPKREDLYGTSVISIQFARNESHLLSIKNRYNHKVDNPDATFSNNLDNIIPGLTKSFEDYYGMKQIIKSKNFEIPKYILASNGKYYKYNYKLGNIYCCPNNIIIDTGKVHKLESDKYLVLDYFILDLVHKKIYSCDESINDYFPVTLGEIEKIDVLKNDYGKKIIIKNKNNEISTIEIDKENKIISYINENVKTIENNFLYCNIYLQELSLPNVIKIGRSFLFNNKDLQKLNLQSVREIGYGFLCWNKSLEELNLPNVIKLGDNILSDNKILKELYLPNVKEIDDYFLFGNEELSELNLPKLERIGDNCLSNNYSLESFNLPNLEIIGEDFLYKNRYLLKILQENMKKREEGKRL